ncbi:MAG: hypothetical protein LBB85_03625 [Dysgonamonadaceae bacterium]|jgi:hypothetical protein|nr:hypothetical protein [Dysgonamonadaceae bacterium]
MKKRIIYILFGIVCATSIVQAQSYSFHKLAELGELFPAACLPVADSIFFCPQITKEKSYIVQYNSKGEMEHLGVSLFSAETKAMINRPVCNFIERVMLELVLQKSSADVKTRLREYKIGLTKNGFEYGKSSFTSLSRLLDEIQNPARFGIRKDSLYTALWEFGDGNRLVLSFPATRELIFGTDKKESDESAGEWLATGECAETPPESGDIDASRLQRIEGTDLYKRKGETFLINQINSDTYYQRSDNRFQPVYHIGYPEESLANLFITKAIKSTLHLQITHRMYGGFTPEFTIPIKRLLCLIKEDFETYCVLHRSNTDGVKISVILHNRNYNYVHLLRITTDAEQLFRENGILKADLYTNIPQHNLKSLF